LSPGRNIEKMATSNDNNNEEMSSFVFSRNTLKLLVKHYESDVRKSKILLEQYIHEDNELIQNNLFPSLCEYYSASFQAKLMVETILDDKDRVLIDIKNNNISMTSYEVMLFESFNNLLKTHKDFLKVIHNISLELQ